MVVKRGSRPARARARCTRMTEETDAEARAGARDRRLDLLARGTGRRGKDQCGATRGAARRGSRSLPLKHHDRAIRALFAINRAGPDRVDEHEARVLAQLFQHVLELRPRLPHASLSTAFSSHHVSCRMMIVLIDKLNSLKRSGFLPLLSVSACK